MSNGMKDSTPALVSDRRAHAANQLDDVSNMFECTSFISASTTPETKGCQGSPCCYMRELQSGLDWGGGVSIAMQFTLHPVA